MPALFKDTARLQREEGTLLHQLGGYANLPDAR